MITLLSPSKKLNLDSQDIVDHYTQCEFIKSAEILANEAKNLTENDLKDLIKAQTEPPKNSPREMSSTFPISINSSFFNRVSPFRIF